MNRPEEQQCEHRLQLDVQDLFLPSDTILCLSDAHFEYMSLL